jgi:predicted PurR-regulated permease PerM
VAVIFALMAGGQLAGFTGVLIALPVAAVLLVFGRRIVEVYLSTDAYNAE